MPQDLTREKVNFGQIVYQWNVKEYDQYKRDRRWYLVIGIIAALLIVYAVLTANYSFALIIVLFGIVLYLQQINEPVELSFAMTTTGIILGQKYYKYSELKNFWMIYNPPEVKNLYFGLNNVIKHRLQVALLDNDPRPIRQYLKQYVTEDLEEGEEPFSDKLSRLLKLQ